MTGIFEMALRFVLTLAFFTSVTLMATAAYERTRADGWHLHLATAQDETLY